MKESKAGIWLMVAATVAIAALDGLVGVVLILRPSGKSAVFGLVFALVSAVLYASYGTLTRRVSDTDTPQTSFAYMTLIGALLSGVLIFLIMTRPKKLAHG